MKRQLLGRCGWRCIAGADPQFRTPPKLALVLSLQVCRPSFLMVFNCIGSCSLSYSYLMYSYTDIIYILKVRE